MTCDGRQEVGTLRSGGGHGPRRPDRRLSRLATLVIRGRAGGRPWWPRRKSVTLFGLEMERRAAIRFGFCLPSGDTGATIAGLQRPPAVPPRGGHSHPPASGHGQLYLTLAAQWRTVEPVAGPRRVHPHVLNTLSNIVQFGCIVCLVAMPRDGTGDIAHF